MTLRLPSLSARRVRTALWAILAVALVLRVGLIVAQRAWRFPNDMEHGSIAVSLMRHGQFAFGDFGYFGPSSVQSPPYPLLLYGLFNLFGERSAGAYIAAMLINAVVGTVGVWLTYVLARTLAGGASVNFLSRREGVEVKTNGGTATGAGALPPLPGGEGAGALPANEGTGGGAHVHWVALTAAALCAVWPTQVYPVTYAQAITLITAATTAVVALWYVSLRTGRVGPWVAYSLIGTVAALTEPVLLPIMALSGLLVLIWPSVLTPRQRVRNAAILLLAAVVVIGPWTIRNRVVHGRWVPIKSTFWVNVWKANNPNATGTDRPALPPDVKARLWSNLWSLSDAKVRDPSGDQVRQYSLLTPEQLARLHNEPDAAREAVFQEWASAWIGENEGAYLRLCLKRLKTTLLIDWDNPKSYSFAYIVPKIGLLVLTVVGAVLAIRRRWSLVYPALLVGSCLLTYTLTITAARFTIPLEPIQLCLAALVVVTVLIPPGNTKDGLSHR